MSLPVIGLTTYRGENKGGHKIAALIQQYISAVAQAGGVPVLIPLGLSNEAIKKLFNTLDGILLTGGGDIEVNRFGGEDHVRVDGVDVERDALEFWLIQQAASQGKPFFGICRGMQVVNVALGGSLYTDLQDQYPDALKHDYDSSSQRQHLAHTVDVDRDSALAGIMGETSLLVNSLHHQGVKDLGISLHPSAHAPDGLVEAVELYGHPYGVAVQWHPEWLLDQSATQRLFRAFIMAADKV